MYGENVIVKPISSDDKLSFSAGILSCMVVNQDLTLTTEYRMTQKVTELVWECCIVDDRNAVILKVLHVAHYVLSDIKFINEWFQVGAIKMNK